MVKAVFHSDDQLTFVHLQVNHGVIPKLTGYDVPLIDLLQCIEEVQLGLFVLTHVTGASGLRMRHCVLLVWALVGFDDVAFIFLVEIYRFNPQRM
jgi:hypothetical protein